MRQTLPALDVMTELLLCLDRKPYDQRSYEHWKGKPTQIQRVCLEPFAVFLVSRRRQLLPPAGHVYPSC